MYSSDFELLELLKARNNYVKFSTCELDLLQDYCNISNTSLYEIVYVVLKTICSNKKFSYEYFLINRALQRILNKGDFKK